MTKVNKHQIPYVSKTFCAYPWVHLHTNPSGRVAPCCIAKSNINGNMGLAQEADSLMDLVNSPAMNQLRLDMISSKENEECSKCFDHERHGILSARQNANYEYAHLLPNILDNTNMLDGSISKFEMRYFDMRFNNICNFKCRTCDRQYSSQWEYEDLKNNVPYAQPVPKITNKNLLQDILEQIPYMEIAYFAGGEPLITEEHYILLEEMIRKNKTDIKLRYNTNLSTLKFKNKDLLDLWKKFKYNIDIYASIDHVGERAEYIRHGTDWEKIKENFITVKKQPFIFLQMNTVLSVFNTLTLYEFYTYLVENKMYDPGDYAFSLYNMSTPEYLSSHILTPDLKKIAIQKIYKTIEFLREKGFEGNHITPLLDAVTWINFKNTWEEHKISFAKEISRLDMIRKENFVKTFPELSSLYTEYKKMSLP